MGILPGRNFVIFTPDYTVVLFVKIKKGTGRLAGALFTFANFVISVMCFGVDGRLASRSALVMSNE